MIPSSVRFAGNENAFFGLHSHKGNAPLGFYSLMYTHF